MIHKLKVLLVFVWLTKLTTGQQLSPQTINAAGKSSSNGSIVLEDAVGGFVVTTIATSTFMYTQDFLQPDAGTTTSVPHINDVVLSSGSGVDNAGTTFIAGNAMIEFTVGEPASITLNNASNLLTQGILQPYSLGSVLPVTGLEFYAKRISPAQVQLNWKTIQEINNKGFQVEKRKENESSFSDIGFVPSSANSGNSSLPLQYQQLDNNNYSGKTLYRLKQEDIDGHFTYSLVRIVNGAGAKQTVLQVWPVPSTGPVNILVSGIEKADNLMVFDMSGKMVQQLKVQNNMQVQLTNLTPGAYFIRLTENKELVQKIIIQ